MKTDTTWWWWWWWWLSEEVKLASLNASVDAWKESKHACTYTVYWAVSTTTNDESWLDSARPTLSRVSAWGAGSRSKWSCEGCWGVWPVCIQTRRRYPLPSDLYYYRRHHPMIFLITGPVLVSCIFFCCCCCKDFFDGRLMIFSFMMRVPRWFQTHWATMTTRAVNNILQMLVVIYTSYICAGWVVIHRTNYQLAMYSFTKIFLLVIYI